MSTIATRIQELRKQKGISQEQLADILMISRQSVSKWESDQAKPEIDKILALSDYFKVSCDYLLKGDELKQTSKEANGNGYETLLIASCMLMIIGLLITFGGWYERRTMDTVVLGMIIQICGWGVYALSRMGKKVFTGLKWGTLFNIWIFLFMPVSLLLGSTIGYSMAPYPDFLPLYLPFFFFVAYIIICLVVSVILFKLDPILTPQAKKLSNITQL